jgi:hypothetical protein
MDRTESFLGKTTVYRGSVALKVEEITSFSESPTDWYNHEKHLLIYPNTVPEYWEKSFVGISLTT